MCLVNSFKVFKDVTDTDEEEGEEGMEKDAVSNGRNPGADCAAPPNNEQTVRDYAK